MKMKCEICGVSVEAESLYRNSPKGRGQKAHWRCINCLDPEYLPEGEFLKEVQSIRERGLTK